MFRRKTMHKLTEKTMDAHKTIDCGKGAEGGRGYLVEF